AIALRSLNNERGDFLITTLPVADPGGSLAEPITLAHFADGDDGWSTQVVLVNLTDDIASGTADFTSQSGSPATLTVNGRSGSQFLYAIAPRSVTRLRTSGVGSPKRGSVRITPSASSRTPSALAIFSYRPGAVTLTEAGVPAARGATAFRLYAERFGPTIAAGSLQTGVAIVNLGASETQVRFDLTYLDGTPTGLTAITQIPGLGQNAIFLEQIQGLGTLPPDFRGLLRISVPFGASISVVGLRGRYNERTEFLITTVPTVNENGLVTMGEAIVPHLADGVGWTTQFVLFSGVLNQSSSGLIRFFSQTGAPLSL